MIKIEPRRIRKVKLTKKSTELNVKLERIEIHYEKMVNGQWDAYTMNCGQRARPELYDALRELLPHAVDLLELPDDYERGAKISGLSISYVGDAEDMGVVMTGQKTLSSCSAPFVFNTPFMMAEENDADQPSLGRAAAVALENVIDEAWKYVEGKRDQMSLFDEDKPTKKSRKKIPIGTTVLGTGPGAERIQ